jgi:hypothetical protein
VNADDVEPLFDVPDNWLDRPMSTVDQVALFLGGSGDSFTGQLLMLFLKADPGNWSRLARAFPAEAVALRAWQDWSRREDRAPTWRELNEYLSQPLPGDGSDL